MGHRSLGAFIAAAEDAGEAQTLSGADPHLELGCLAELKWGLIL